MIVGKILVCQWIIISTRMMKFGTNNCVSKALTANYSINNLANVVFLFAMANGKDILHITTIACHLMKVARIWV